MPRKFGTSQVAAAQGVAFAPQGADILTGAKDRWHKQTPCHAASPSGRGVGTPVAMSAAMATTTARADKGSSEGFGWTDGTLSRVDGVGLNNDRVTSGERETQQHLDGSPVRRFWVLRHVWYVNLVLADGRDAEEESSLHWRRIVSYGGETW